MSITYQLIGIGTSHKVYLFKDEDGNKMVKRLKRVTKNEVNLHNSSNSQINEIIFALEMNSLYPDQFIKLHNFAFFKSNDKHPNFKIMTKKYLSQIKKDKLAILTTYEYVDKILSNKLDNNIICQILHCLYLIQKHGYTHSDIHFENIGINLTEKNINILGHSIKCKYHVKIIDYSDIKIGPSNSDMFHFILLLYNSPNINYKNAKIVNSELPNNNINNEYLRYLLHCIENPKLVEKILKIEVIIEPLIPIDDLIYLIKNYENIEECVKYFLAKIESSIVKLKNNILDLKKYVKLDGNLQDKTINNPIIMGIVANYYIRNSTSDIFPVIDNIIEKNNAVYIKYRDKILPIKEIPDDKIHLLLTILYIAVRFQEHNIYIKNPNIFDFGYIKLEDAYIYTLKNWTKFALIDKEYNIVKEYQDIIIKLYGKPYKGTIYSLSKDIKKKI